MKLLLKDVRWYSQGQTSEGNLRIARGRIQSVATGLRARPGEKVLDGGPYLAFPGLINAHDHLEFNLFPRLGSPPYPNSTAWAEDIYHPNQTPLREILEVPVDRRYLWGAYKNLLSGVTTLVHHNAHPGRICGPDLPVRVLKDYRWAHSLRFERNIVRSHRKGKGPFMIHAAEGTDIEAALEIARLDTLGVLDADTVLIHGIALNENQIERLSQLGTSLVWCPATGNYLYGRSAPILRLKGRVRCGLGTDSTLTGSPTLWHEMKTASAGNLLSPREIVDMVTVVAARIFGLAAGEGTLATGALADLILIEDTDRPAPQTLLSADPTRLALVLREGRPLLAAPAVAQQLGLPEPNLQYEGSPLWVAGPFERLKRQIGDQVPSDILERNPLWTSLDGSCSRS